MSVGAVSSAKRKSYEAENELANILWSMGFAVIRGPASGGGARKRFQPDLVAVKNGKILVFEIKRCSDEEKPLYLDSSQILGLQEWGRRAGGSVYIAIRFKGGEWRFHEVKELEVTRGGNFKLDKPKSGLRLREFIELIEAKTRPLTEYIEYKSGDTA